MLDEEELETFNELECGVMYYLLKPATNVRTEVYVNSSIAKLSGMSTEEVLHVCYVYVRVYHGRNALRICTAICTVSLYEEVLRAIWYDRRDAICTSGTSCI